MVGRKKASAKRPDIKKVGSKKAAAKKPPVRKVAADEADQDIFTLPFGDLSLNQLIAAHVLNENSKPPHQSVTSVTFPVQLSDADVARIGAAVIALLSPPEE